MVSCLATETSADAYKVIGTVVSLLIVNSDDLPPSAFDAVFQSAGLVSLSYSPPTSSVLASAWPTLGSMIDNGTRLVTFLDTGADFTSVTYLIDGAFS